MIDNNNIDMKSYYEFRQELHKLYSHDTNNHGDLCCGILELRDKNKFIESIDLDITNYSIMIEFADDAPKVKIDTVIGKCTNIIMNYILENIGMIKSSIANSDEIDTYLHHPNNIFCDIMIMKNIVNIGL